MLTYLGRRNLFGTLANNSSSATLSAADILMNDSEKRIISAKDWPFLNKQLTLTTSAGVQAYKLPAYTEHPQSVYITVGSYRYTPKEVSTREEWDSINEVSVSSDIPTHFFIYNGAVEIFPIPSTSSNTITVNARLKARDLNITDYTTGSITTVATSGTTTTVTSSGATWHTGMIGRFIRITDGDAANTLSGDHQWYEIATVPSASTLTLVRAYGGTAIAAATAAYTIGQVSLIPEPHNQLPVFKALEIHFTSIDPNTQKAQLYKRLYDEGYEMMWRDYIGKIDVVLDSGEEETSINPNFLIHL